MNKKRLKIASLTILLTSLLFGCNLPDVEDELYVDYPTAPPTVMPPTPNSTPVLPYVAGDKFALWLDGPHLRGANIWQALVIPDLDGLQFKGSGPVGPPFTQADFDRLAALGANYVVISGPGVFTEQLPYEVDSDVVANLDDLLDMIARADMFATIAFRTGPGRSEFGLCCDGEGEFAPYTDDSMWQDQAAQDAWVKMWRYTAERYKDNPIVVGYKLMVEPNANGLIEMYEPDKFYAQYDGTLSDWNQLYPRLVDGIREVDSQTPILIGGAGWSAVAWLPYLQPVDDPRVVYVAHQYEPQDDYTHQSPRGRNEYPGTDFDLDYDHRPDVFDRAWLDNFLAPIDAFMTANNVPVAVDEFGVMRWVPGAAMFMNDEIGLFEERGLNYALWEWQTSWPPFAEEVHDFTFTFGPDPKNLKPVNNDLQDVIVRYWSRNIIRPSGWNTNNATQ
ncbi:MAG: glycoside hydrolase family 5 protein [Anaerolineales bacterium]|nr:glycoside hydrolase family 5 protein [Anaerolineales bacterium]